MTIQKDTKPIYLNLNRRGDSYQNSYKIRLNQGEAVRILIRIEDNYQQLQEIRLNRGQPYNQLTITNLYKACKRSDLTDAALLAEELVDYSTPPKGWREPRK